MTTPASSIMDTTGGPGFNFHNSNGGIVTFAFKTRSEAEVAHRQLVAVLAAAVSTHAHL